MDTNASGCLIPYEVITIILGHVWPHQSIMQCRLVCKMWRDIIENESWRFVIKLKESKREPYTDAQIKKISKMPWFILHVAYAENSLFGRNFVITKHPQNSPIWNLGDLDSGSWKTVPMDDPTALTPEDELSNREEFLVLKLPTTVFDVYDGFTKVTQIIQLPKSGLSSLIMKKLPLKIYISCWFRLTSRAVKPDFETRYPERYINTEYRLQAKLQNVADCETISYVDRNAVSSSADLRECEWRKFRTSLTVPKPPSEMNLNTLHIIHSLSGRHAKAIVTRILIRIKKPAFFTVDWNSVFKRDLNVKTESLASLLISEHQLFLRTGIDSRGTSLSSLLPHYYHENRINIGLLRFPESGILAPDIWYSRPIADILEAENKFADPSIRYEKGEYLLLYELRCKIHLKRQGLYGFFMDDVQPPIEAYVDENIRLHSNAMKYEIMMNLQDNDGKILHQKKASEKLCKGDSKKLSLRFENYGKGVAYVEFSIRRHMSMVHRANRCDDCGHTFSTDCSDCGEWFFNCCSDCGRCFESATFQDHVKSVIGMSRVQVLLP